MTHLTSDITLIPKSVQNFVSVDASLVPCRLATLVNADICETSQVDLNAVELSNCGSQGVASVDGEKVHTDAIGIFNLKKVVSNKYCGSFKHGKC